MIDTNPTARDAMSTIIDVALTMAGKKRAAKAASASTKKAATKRAATAAAKKKSEDEKQKKKTTIVAAACDDGNEKYHILRLIPIEQDECFTLLNAKGVDCSAIACDDRQKLGEAITLKLPLNCQDIEEDIFDYYSSDNECKKQSKKPDITRYYRHNNGSYYVRTELGRSEIMIRAQSHSFVQLSRELCYVGLTNNGEAWISMRQDPGAHLVHIDGKIIDDPQGVKRFVIHNGTVLSFFNLNFAYRVEIESSVLANKKNAHSKMDEVFTEYNKCCVCLEPYDVDQDPADGAQNGADSGPRLPIKGTCGHTVCEGCLDTLHVHQSSGSVTRRYVNCPKCRNKTFDVRDKVKDYLLCDLIEARQKFDSDGENNQAVAKQPATDGSKQVPSEVAMLRKEFETEKAQLRKKICEIEKEKTRLKKRNEELEKLALENAKRIEELESKPKASVARKEMEDTDYSDTEDVETVEVDVLSESAPMQQGHDSETNSTHETFKVQAKVWACTECTFWNTNMRRKTCEMCRKKRK